MERFGSHNYVLYVLSVQLHLITEEMHLPGVLERVHQKSQVMSSMFRSATAFNQNVGGLNVSAVTTMQYMFNQCNCI